MGMPSGGFGPAVITWETLTAWSALRGVDIDPRDALVLVRLGHRRAVILQEDKSDAGANTDRPNRKRHQPHRK